MAGTDPKLVIKIGASLEELKRALADGRVLIDNTSTSLGRMTASLRGDKLLQDAQRLVQGVKEVGGAATLTEKQQARVNAQLQEAIQKYGLLGPAAQKASGIAIAEMRQLEAQTRKVETATGSIGTLLGKFGPMLAASFSVGAVMGGLRSLVQWADDLEEVSQGLGMNVERLQQLQYAWATTGSSVEAGIKAIQTMQEKLSEGTSAGALRRLGVDFEAIKRLAPEEQFDLITGALGELTDQTDFAALGADIFGKSWKSVGISVKNGMQEAADHASKLTKEELQNIASLQSAWERLIQTAKIYAGKAISTNVGKDQGGWGAGITPGEMMLKQDPILSWLWNTQTPGLPKAPSLVPFGPGLAAPSSDVFLQEITKQAKAVDLLKVSLWNLNKETESFSDHTVEFSAQGKEMRNVLAGWTKEGDLLSTTFEDQIALLPEYEGNLTDVQHTTAEAAKGTKTWRSELSSLSQSFRMLQSSAGEGGLGHFAQTMAMVTGSMEMGADAGASVQTSLLGLTGNTSQIATGLVGLASSFIQLAAAMEQATQSSSRWENAVGGAATGASYGASALKGTGYEAYGAAVGGAAGFIYGYYKHNESMDVTEAQRDAWANSMGGYDELNRLVQAGTISVADYNTVVSAGTYDAEKFQDATESIGRSLKENAAILDANGLSYTKMVDALKKAAQGTKTIADAISGATTQTQFARLGTYTSAIFGRMLHETGSLADALAAVGDTLDAMITASQEFGLSITGPIAQLLNFRGILTNNPDLAARITGLGQIGGLGNLLGPMNLQATFGADLADTFKELMGRGGVNQNQALALMQGPLQALWESTQNGLQQQPLDAETQALLDLALGYGFIGKDMTSLANQQLDVLTEIRDLLAGGTSDKPDWNAAALKESGALAAGYSSYAAMEAALASGVNPQYTDPSSPDYRGYAEGTNGFEYFGSGTPAMLHNWERVQTPAQAHAELASAAGGGSVTVQFYEIHAVDADGFEQLMAKKGVPAFTKAVRTNAYKNNPELAATLRNLVN